MKISLKLVQSISKNDKFKNHVTGGTCLTRILGLGKSVLHEIYVSGTAVGPLLTQKSPHACRKIMVVGDPLYHQI